jgi:hypothetical protein
MKKVKEMKPGVRYPGYGFVNEYGEFQFTPSEVGSRAGQKKLLKSCENYTVHTTTKCMIFHLCIDRKMTVVEKIRKIIELMNELINIVREYEV